MQTSNIHTHLEYPEGLALSSHADYLKKYSLIPVILSWPHSCFRSLFPLFPLLLLCVPSSPPFLPHQAGRQGDPRCLLLSVQMLNHCDSLYSLAIVLLTKSCFQEPLLDIIKSLRECYLDSHSCFIDWTVSLSENMASW